MKKNTTPNFLFLFGCLALLFWIFPFGFAQNVSAKVVQGGVLIDGTGGAVLENSVIVIQNGKISAVGALGEVDIPQDSEIIDRARNLAFNIIYKDDELKLPENQKIKHELFNKYSNMLEFINIG